MSQSENYVTFLWVWTVILGSLLACTAADAPGKDTTVPTRTAAPAETLARPASAFAPPLPPATIPATTPATAVDRAENPLLTALRDSFRLRNPRIDTVRVMELRRYYPDYSAHLLLGYGVRALDNTQGPMDDELFGLFVTDASLTRIVRTVDILPTRRWRDYRVWISRFTPDTVEIEGAGQTYGDGPLRRVYRWMHP